MSYRFEINGVSYENQSVDELSLRTVIARNQVMQGLLESQEGRVRFIDSAYRMLYDTYFDDGTGFCDSLPITIFETCDGSEETLFEGLIKLSDIEFDITKCEARARLTDNSFFAVIDNNKRVDVNLDSTHSKNDVELTVPELYDVTMYNPNTGNNYGTPAKAFKLADIYRFVTSYISDNEITVSSELLDDSNLFVTDGYALKNLGLSPDTNRFKFSFQSLNDEINRKYNSGFKVRFDNGEPVIVLEIKDRLYNEATVLTLPDAVDVRVRTARNRLYSAVKLGSKHSADFPYLAFPENANVIGFREEQFHAKGQCNTDRVLDLVSDWVYSSNIIEDSLKNSDDWLNLIHVIECENVDDVAKTADAVKHSVPNLSATKRYYNMSLNNDSVLQRYYGYVHNTLIDKSISIDDKFAAATAGKYVWTVQSQWNPTVGDCGIGWLVSGNTPVICDQPFPFPTELNDNNNNYDNATFEYIVPVDGQYTFASFIKLSIGLNFPMPSCATVYHHCEFVLTDSTGAVTKNIVGGSKGWNSTGSKSYQTTGVLDCIAGDRVHVRMYVFVGAGVNCLPNNQPHNFVVTLKSGTEFRVSDGVLATDLSLSKITEYDFRYPMSEPDFKSLQASVEGKVQFTTHDETHEGFIERVQYDHWRNEIRFRLSNAIANAT